MSADFKDANARVRQRAVVAAARAGDGAMLPQLERLAHCDPSQQVRREAASAIGRLSRNYPQAFAMLVGLSEHGDPGVVIQAARGLVSARTDGQRAIAEPILIELAQHPNEVLREFVQSERARAAQIANRRPRRGGGGGERVLKQTIECATFAMWLCKAMHVSHCDVCPTSPSI